MLVDRRLVKICWWKKVWVSALVRIRGSHDGIPSTAFAAPFLDFISRMYDAGIYLQQQHHSITVSGPIMVGPLYPTSDAPLRSNVKT